METIRKGEAALAWRPAAPPRAQIGTDTDCIMARLHAAGEINAESPRVVIRGETKGKVPPRLHVDWVGFTLKRLDGPELFRWVSDALEQYTLAFSFAGEEDKGFNGYRRSRVLVHQGKKRFGRVCWEGNRNTSHCYLTGVACSALHPEFYKNLKLLLDRFDGKLTRIDLALDLFEGEFTVVGLLEAYMNEPDAFRGRAGGRLPKYTQHGPWETREAGLTLDIGTRGGGKLLRGYEKGKKEGNPSSPWVRYEVEFRRKDRLIELEILDCENWSSFFAGAFPYLERVVQAVAWKLKTGLRGRVEGLTANFIRTRDGARNQYGKFVGWLTAAGFQQSEIVALLSRGADWPPGLLYADVSPHCVEAIRKLPEIARVLRMAQNSGGAGEAGFR